MESRWAIEVDKYYRKNVDPVFGDLDIKDVTPKKVRAWLRGFETKPYAGNRSLEVLSKMYSIAIQEELITHNPCKLIQALGEKKRDRLASDEEIKKICDILDRELEFYPHAATFIYTLMYTGARPASLIKAKRADLTEIEINGETWGKLIFNGKSTAATGSKERIMIPPKALALIECLEEPEDGSIFGIPFPRYFWHRIRKEAGCDDMWARDWRRTFASLCLASGVQLDTIGELLNHQSTQTTKLYAKLNDHARTVAISTVANTINAIKSS
jgi:integrase